MSEPIEHTDVAAPAPGDPPTWERLDPRYVTMETRVGGLWSAGMAIVWFALFAVLTMPGPLARFRAPAFALWALATASHVAWYQLRPRLTYRHSAFRLDADGIEIRRGAVFRSIVSVPRSRVQHTDVSQGPFERKHGLGTLHIYTAGVSHAEVPLAGLPHARALEIRDALLPRERAIRG